MTFRNGDRVILAPGPEFNSQEAAELSGRKGMVVDTSSRTFIDVLLDEPYERGNRTHHKVFMYPEELVSDD